MKLQHTRIKFKFFDLLDTSPPSLPGAAQQTFCFSVIALKMMAQTSSEMDVFGLVIAIFHGFKFSANRFVHVRMLSKKLQKNKKGKNCIITREYVSVLRHSCDIYKSAALHRVPCASCTVARGNPSFILGTDLKGPKCLE